MSKEIAAYSKRQHDADCQLVRRYMEGWEETGAALQRIHDGGHYEGTFEEFCKTELGISRVHGHRLMKSSRAAAVVKSLPPEVSNLLPMGNINERQARELSTLENEEQMATVTAKAVETAPKDKDGKPKLTAKHIRETAAEVLNNGEPHDDEPDEDEEDEPEEDPTTQELMEDYNLELERFCRKLLKTFKEECPDHPWTRDRGRMSTAEQQVKSACATLRVAKGHGLCPKCSGDGCKACHQSGWMPKVMIDQMG